MLQFHASHFVTMLNSLDVLEGQFRQSDLPVNVDEMLDFYKGQLMALKILLGQINLTVSASHAERMKIIIENRNPKTPAVIIKIINEYSEELRRRIADELDGRVFYYISDNVNLMSDLRPFGDLVDDAFPSARYDVVEAGRCLALRRSTACVFHLMCALEVPLASLSAALEIRLDRETWGIILEKIKNEILRRSTRPSSENWKDKDEPFFTQAAIHFQMVKDGWRNHTMHGREKFTEERAEEIYESVRSFMRHLSERLSEEGLSS